MIPIDPKLSLNLYTEFFVDERKNSSIFGDKLAASMIELSIGKELQSILGDDIDVNPQTHGF